MLRLPKTAQSYPLPPAGGRRLTRSGLNYLGLFVIKFETGTIPSRTVEPSMRSLVGAIIKVSRAYLGLTLLDATEMET